MKKILLIAGARPNFMKIAPVVRALQKHTDSLCFKIVHTGQHYDAGMSQTFFDELGIPQPEYNLNVGSASHSVQTANIMMKIEGVCITEKPDIVVVVGDVNSTVACGLVAKKLNIALAHIEAGLRSNDRTMPEEINRIVTDAISDHLFVTEKSGMENLLREGHDAGRIHFVGHVMIDNLYYQLDWCASAPLAVGKELKRAIGPRYAVLTMHRPSNVDNKETLSRLISCFKKLSAIVPIIFPCHPRTLARIKEHGLIDQINEWKPGDFDTFGKLSDRTAQSPGKGGGLLATAPLGYMDFLHLWKDAACVLTDSGGLQEETTALKIPCITFRESTERPITVEVGSNEVVGTDTQKIEDLFRKAVDGKWKKSSVPELWDGKASERIVNELERWTG